METARFPLPGLKSHTSNAIKISRAILLPIVPIDFQERKLSPRPLFYLPCLCHSPLIFSARKIVRGIPLGRRARSESLRGKHVGNFLGRDAERKLVEMGQSGFNANPPVAPFIFVRSRVCVSVLVSVHVCARIQARTNGETGGGE